MNQQRVIWLLPVKNGMPYLIEALASIESQTYTEWEVLAWDNGSTDGSGDELERWIPARLPGRVVRDRALPLGAALAEMVKLARTPYCARIDADDVNLPHRLEKQVDFLEHHPDVAVVGCHVNRIDAAGRNHGRCFSLALNHDDIVHRLLHDWVLCHPAVLLRREYVLEVGNYRDMTPSQDHDLWMRLAARYRLANLEEVLLNLRVHEQSVTGTALRQGITVRRLQEIFADNAPELFGITRVQSLKLRTRQLRYAFWTLYRVASHLSRTQGGTTLARLRSASFVEACRKLVAPTDVVTRLLIAVLDHTPDSVRQECFALGNDLSALRKRICG